MGKTKSVILRVTPEMYEALEVVCSFGGNSINQGLINSIKTYTEKLFAKEIKEGSDILLSKRLLENKTVKEIYLKDVCNALEIPFSE